LLVAMSVCMVVVALTAVLSRLRRDIDPSSTLRERAARVTRLMPAAFVVMGHTHLPEVTAAPGGTSTYVNLGSWDGDDDVANAARTHLVVYEREDGKAVAELFVWDKASGRRAWAKA
jgi:predicted phosphodiesterase